MKISLKIFVVAYCVLMLITVTGGFILVNSLYERDMSKAMEQALENNEVLYTYITTIEDLNDNSYAEYSLVGLTQRMGQKNENKSVFVGNYEEWKKTIVLKDIEDINAGEIISSIISKNNRTTIQVTSKYRTKYIINYLDISDILEQRDENYNLYRNIIIIASVMIAIILYCFSWYITRPLTKVTNMAASLSQGDFTARIDSSYKKMKSYEVAVLGDTLNQLAINTEEHIMQLEDIAQKREDFVGNFTHEIKTPLTSIIGYADLIRTYDLKPEKRREYGNFIYNEGKRLEQLSLNLLQLIVMGRTNFSLVPINTSEFFDKLNASVKFLTEKYHVVIRMRCEPAVVLAEPSLISAAVINLIDNACKASEEGQRVSVIGKIKDDQYGFIVVDNGRGIPEEEIEKIFEPFYMVDKSRARSQGGAGLGLAMCNKIAEIHNGKLGIKSTVGKGTSAMILVNLSSKK